MGNRLGAKGFATRNLLTAYSRQKRKEYTQMTRRRFDELRQAIVDGSLAEKWKDVNEDSLTKKDRVEFRQVNFIITTAQENPDFIRELTASPWRRIRVFEMANGSIGTLVE